LLKSIGIFILGWVLGMGMALHASGDTTHATLPSLQGSSKEMELEEIVIQGSPEAPSVIIVPKRIEPEMNQDPLERSFKEELNKEFNKVPQPNELLHQIEDVKSIKKTVEKERKLQK